MVTKRAHYYYVDHQYTGFIDLHTDIFFIFWRDLFTSDKNKDALDVDTELENDKKTPIHIVVEEAKSDDEEATKNIN